MKESLLDEIVFGISITHIDSKGNIRHVPVMTEEGQRIINEHDKLLEDDKTRGS